jgi:hypothetical protein
MRLFNFRVNFDEKSTNSSLFYQNETQEKIAKIFKNYTKMQFIVDILEFFTKKKATHSPKQEGCFFEIILLILLR